jgi:hypothetical protein
MILKLGLLNSVLGETFCVGNIKVFIKMCDQHLELFSQQSIFFVTYEQAQ